MDVNKFCYHTLNISFTIIVYFIAVGIIIIIFVLYFRPSSGQVVSQTVELLVHACSSQDHHIRLAASENLRRLIKVWIVHYSVLGDITLYAFVLIKGWIVYRRYYSICFCAGSGKTVCIGSLIP